MLDTIQPFELIIKLLSYRLKFRLQLRAPMASKLMLMAFAVAAAAAIFSDGAMAMEYVVGDDQGWRPGFNYTAWAKGKQFFVGDSLGN